MIIVHKCSNCDDEQDGGMVDGSPAVDGIYLAKVRRSNCKVDGKDYYYTLAHLMRGRFYVSQGPYTVTILAGDIIGHHLVEVVNKPEKTG